LEVQAREKQKTYWLLLTTLLALFTLAFSYLIFRQQKMKLDQQKQEFQLKEEISRIETQNKLQEQRLSISRDLHDNIGSQLTFIISAVNNLKFRYKTENLTLLKQLNKIGDFATETIVELRDTIWAMNAGTIKFGDLRARIFNFLEKAREAGNEINTGFEIDDSLTELELNVTAGINIYRSIQEAVNNAIKHSGADLILIGVKNRQNYIEITVSDNGKGFNSAETEKGNGLYNMSKRMEEIGAKFNVETENSKGTKISLLIQKELVTENKRLK
jgi:signal transduction histidine kinase